MDGSCREVTPAGRAAGPLSDRVWTRGPCGFCLVSGLNCLSRLTAPGVGWAEEGWVELPDFSEENLEGAAAPRKWISWYQGERQGETEAQGDPAGWGGRSPRAAQPWGGAGAVVGPRALPSQALLAPPGALVCGCGGGGPGSILQGIVAQL